MSKIKIIGTQKKPSVPKASELNKVVPRMKPMMNKTSVALDKSYNRQGNK